MDIHPSPIPSYEVVSRLAHELWEQRGRPQDQARDHWFEAERRAWAAAKSDESLSASPSVRATYLRGESASDRG